MRSAILPLFVSALLVSPAFGGPKTPGVKQGPEDAKLLAPGLSKFLTDLGYAPEKVGETTQRLTIERGRFTFRINVSISGNEKKVWMSSYLVQLDDLTKIPAKAMTDALMANSEIGPAHFYLVKVGDKYWLKTGFALDNRNITPAYFRSELDWFLERMSDKADVWAKEKWTGA